MATIDGLVSGLQTTALIDSLMTLQAGQQNLLAQRKTSTSSLVTALQALNTKTASLAEHAAKTAKPASWDVVKGAISQTGVTAPGATVSTGTGAQVGTLDFRVGAVAQSQSSLVRLPTSFGSTTPSFTVTRDGVDVTVTAASTSVADIAAAFNNADAGVRATAVKVNVLDGNGDPTGDTTYRLQLTGTATGTDNAFTVTHDGAALTLDTIRAAGDASITLFPGTSAAQTLTSASNTFTGVMTGVDLTVSAVTAADAANLTVAVERDAVATKALASGLVGNLNTVLTEISSRSKSTTGTASDGGTLVKGGLFSGETATRLLQQNLLTQGSLPVGGKSPADVGIVLGKDGTFTFDDAKFTAAMAADAQGTTALVQEVGKRLEAVAKAASAPQTGTLSSSITDKQASVKDMTDRIADWDDRLAARRASLERLYASLETTLSGMQSQASYLSSYLSSMSSSSSKS